ncbi:MAG: type I pullulanase, partial [Clostridiaceae bacterium]
MKKSELKDINRIKKKATEEYKKVKKPVFTMEEILEEKPSKLIPTIFDVPLKEPLKVDVENVGKIKVVTGSAMRTPEFDDKYYYDGELGPIYSKDSTVLRLWAPTAVNVEAVFYDDLNPQSEVQEVIPMLELDKGIWEVTLEGDMKNRAYTYRLSFSDGLVNQACDPYSKAVTANGGRTVIIDSADTVLDGFKRMPEFSSPVDAVIYEAHIRDLSISPDSGIEAKGKYNGVVESGTVYKDMPTGLDYIKNLGITHLQILPMFDFASVDELAESPAYNWGYDPLNFNVPEGSYSTDPGNPIKRILELKNMVKKLHDNGIRAIMDVVYNHVFDVKLQNLHLTVPGYYFRYNEKGELSNGTGVGNDTASERRMMRKYILDSIIYWTEEFKLDGFRFDLMGIHDVDLMNSIREELDKIDPSIIILGEGWKLDTPIPETMKANQWNSNRMPRIAHFNDSMRDIVKGSVFLDKEKGFISGKHVENLVFLNMAGAYNLPNKVPSFQSPDRVIQYVEAHDNYT